ncbi:MAG: hypothetical protein ACPGUC_09720, partial [Gammaproteobacteria bacterium]
GVGADAIIDSFDSGAQFESHTGGGGSYVSAPTVLGGFRHLHVVSTTATVSGTAPGNISASGDSGQTTRIDLSYGSYVSGFGASDWNLDLSGESEITFAFESLSGDARIDSIQLFGDGINDVWIQQTIVSLSASASPFTATVDFSLFGASGGSEPDLNTFLQDVDGMLIYVIGNDDIEFEISEISFGEAGASASALTVPGTFALISLGIMSVLRTRKRIEVAPNTNTST